MTETNKLGSISSIGCNLDFYFVFNLPIVASPALRTNAKEVFTSSDMCSCQVTLISFAYFSQSIEECSLHN